MTGMYGADTDALRELAGVFGHDDLSRVGIELVARTEAIVWMGRDADAFRERFRDSVARMLIDLDGALDALSDDLERQAHEQDVASDAARAGFIPGSFSGNPLGSLTGSAAGAFPGAPAGSNESTQANGAPFGLQAGSLAGSAAQAAPGGQAPRKPSDDYPGVFPPRIPPEGVSEDDARAAMERLRAAERRSPDQVVDEFNDMTPEEQYAAAYYFPEEVGMMEGAPYTLRDTANRWVLQDRLDNPDPMDFTVSVEESTFKSRYSQLQDIAAELASGRDPEMQLVSLDDSTPSGTWTAAISYGNLDTATNATYVVPGMLSDVKAETINGQAVAAQNIRERLKHEGIPREDSAVVSWMGYDTPSVAEEPSLAHAQLGAERLQDALAGYDARHPRDSTTFNVAAFSYGTTTTAEALLASGETYGVDNVVLYGSAGVSHGALTNFDANAPGAPDVYTTDAARDLLNDVGQTSPAHPVDPRLIPGVTSFDSDGDWIQTGTLRYSQPYLDITRAGESPNEFPIYEPVPDRLPVEGHTLGDDQSIGYLSPESESLHHSGRILADTN